MKFIINEISAEYNFFDPESMKKFELALADMQSKLTAVDEKNYVHNYELLEACCAIYRKGYESIFGVEKTKEIFPTDDYTAMLKGLVEMTVAYRKADADAVSEIQTMNPFANNLTSIVDGRSRATRRKNQRKKYKPRPVK